MKTKHTPGPWKMAEIEDDTKNLTHMIVAEYNENLLITYALPPTDIADEFYANAKLIASAPYLLEALKALSGQINLSKLDIRKDFCLINAHAAALKAIQKATS